MSYILEALKKAEAERQLGNVPSLHAQPVAASPAVSVSGKHRWLIGASALALATVLLALFWAQPWKPAPVRIADAAPPAAVATAPAKAQAEAPVALPEPAPAQTQPDIPAESTQAAPVASKAKSEKQVARPKPQAPAAEARAPSSAPVSAPASAPVPAVAVNSRPQAEPAAAPPLSSAPLPETQPREVPQIVIGGYLYSDNPRDRQLIVNKRLLREGEEAAPGLVLEKMTPKAAIFNYKGYRYQVNY